jgi:Protein of unknown function (DUF1353)
VNVVEFSDSTGKLLSDATARMPWVAIEGASGFLVESSDGGVRMMQVDVKNFLVSTPFEFADKELLGKLRTKVERNGHPPTKAAEMVELARTYAPASPPILTSDLASVPRFLAWFEAPYGRHTLAAILHDQLIVDKANAGPLGSDTLSDSFFRNMLGVTGVPVFKRWLMWTAVAARTRFVAGGWRRISLIVWALLAVVGISCFVAGVGHVLFGWPLLLGYTTRLLLFIGLGLPFVAGFLWGKQYGASIVAAGAGLWLIPAGAIVLFALGVYFVAENCIFSVAMRLIRSFKKIAS